MKAGNQLLVIIAFLLLGISINSLGQVVQFESLDMSDGLSSSNVFSIAQDNYGFIWIGTYKGLNIYNGIDFSHYYSDPEDEFSLPGNQIEKILIKGDTTYIGTNSGLCMMDVVSKKCTLIDIGKKTRIRTLYLDKENAVLWIGSQEGLVRYNMETKEFRWYNTTNSNITHNIIRSIYQDSNGTLWIGTFDKLNSLAPNSTVFEQISLPDITIPNVKNNLVLSIQPFDNVSDSLLWIGTQTGLVLFNRAQRTVEKVFDERNGLTNSVIKDIHTTKNNKLWLGTDFGLVEMERGEIHELHVHDPYKKNSLANSKIWAIFEDKAGALWFGTENGVSILSNSTYRFNFYPMVFEVNGVRTGYEIRSIIEDRDRQLWMATQNGFIRYNPQSKKLQSFNADIPLFSDAISIFEDSKGRIWVATNGGITLYDPITKKLKNYSANVGQTSGLRTNYIFGFVEKSNGDLLVNTFVGLHKVSEKNGRISFDFIGKLNIHSTGNNALWSYEETKLYKLDPKTFERQLVFDYQSKDKNNHFLTFLSDSLHHKIWIGADNHLLSYDIDSQSYRIFDIQSNKKYPLLSLLHDGSGNIWASSYSAIVKFSCANDEFEIFPIGEGISLNRFFENSAFQSQNGDILYGGQDGFVRFSPKDIAKSEFAPQIRFTKLIVANNEITPTTKIDNRSIIDNNIAFTDKVVLDYLNGSFALEFSSLHYGNRSGIRYKYMLEGEDQDWNYLDNPKGRATYSRLMAGNYIFRVRGSNTDGVWSGKETTLSIKIKPPLWASIYFISIYVFIVIVILWSLLYYYHKRTRWKNQMKIIKLEKEHMETEAKNRQRFFTNVAHEFRTPLNLIIAPLDKLLTNKSLDDSAKRSVQLIDNNASRLLWLNNQFLEMRKVENKTMQIDNSEFEVNEFLNSIYMLFEYQAECQNIKYNIKNIDEPLIIESDFHKLETIVFNLLSNAFKYTDDNGEITLKIDRDDYNIFISVRDTGPGITAEDQKRIFDRFYQTTDSGKTKRGLGIGLNLVKEYVIMLKGEINLQSEPGKGSEFFVRLPLNGNFVNESTIKKEIKKPTLTSGRKVIAVKASVNYPKDAPSILLIEDDKELADFINESLREKYRVELVPNGAKALKVLTKLKPNLVVSDIDMPEMDGIEFTKRLKGNPKTAHIPIIIISGASQKESQLAALREGADAYIVKPFVLELLELRIENYLKRDNHLSEIYKLSKLSQPREIEVSSQNEKIIKKVVDCIEKYMSDPDLNIDKVCEDTGFSHTFLYRKIKKYTGQTLKEFIRTVRLRRAAQLLKTRKLTVLEVMVETGFSNHSYFSKCFKQIYNVSPKEYINE